MALYSRPAGTVVIRYLRLAEVAKISEHALFPKHNFDHIGRSKTFDGNCTSNLQLYILVKFTFFITYLPKYLPMHFVKLINLFVSTVACRNMNQSKASKIYTALII